MFWNDQARAIMQSERDRSLLDSAILVQSVCNSIYITRNFGPLKMIRDGLTLALSNENAIEMKHWISVADELQMGTIFEEYDQCKVLVKLFDIQNSRNKKSAEAASILQEAIAKVPQAKITIKLKYQTPMEKLISQLDQISNPEEQATTVTDICSKLETLVNECEQVYPELDLIEQARHKTIAIRKQKLKNDIAEDALELVCKTQILEDLESVLKLANIASLDKDHLLVEKANKLLEKEKVTRQNMKLQCEYNNSQPDCTPEHRSHLWYYVAKDNKKKIANFENEVSNDKFRSYLKLTKRKKRKAPILVKPKGFQAQLAVLFD